MDRHVGRVVADDRNDAIRAAEGGASGTARLDDQQTRFAIRVPHVGGAHQGVGDGALKCELTVFGIFELPVIISAGETLSRELSVLHLRS